MSVNVLIVDDSETVRKKVAQTLLDAGMVISEAMDGQAGVERIMQGGVDCVIADLNMPRKNGIEMVEEVKADPRFADLPILMLTTEGSKELVQRAKAAGACGWIVKPFREDLLVAAVMKLTCQTA